MRTEPVPPYMQNRPGDFDEPQPDISSWITDAVQNTVSKFKPSPRAAMWIGFAFVLFIASGAFADLGWKLQQLPSAACEGVTVEPGDTMSSLANESGNSLADLQAMNPHIPNNDVLYAGDFVCFEFSNPSLTVAHQQALNMAAAEAISNAYSGGYTDYDNGGPKPGAVALAVHLEELKPHWGRSVDPLYGIGIYNNRNARGGGNKSTHATGRAVDVYIPDCYGDQEYAEFFGTLVAAAGDIGIQRVLVCDLEWRSDIGYITPSDNLAAWHDGRKAPAHFHIELSHDAAERLTAEMIDRVL